MVYFTVVTLGDARAGGGRPAKSVVKKKVVTKTTSPVFRGGRLWDTLFFYYDLFPQLAPPRPTCAAPRHGDLLVPQVVFHL